MIYFTSDTHFSHSNAIKLMKRPFKSVEEMDAEIINRWNSVVGTCDLVYHLGDYAFSHSKEYLHSLRAKLNGKIILIAGNHDRDKALKESRIDTIYGHVKQAGVKTYPMIRVNLNGQQIILCHYAMRVWDKSHYGVWHLYGHSHGNLYDDPNSLSMDVGVDSHNFTPLSFEEVKEIMSKKTFKPIDHHRRRDEQSH